MLLPELAVVFFGIVGDDTGRVDQQVHLMLQEDVTVTKLDVRRARTLARHGEASRGIVRELHVDGAVGGELIRANGRRTLRMVVYTADGAMRSLFEVPVTGKLLTRDELAMLHENLADDVAALHKAAPIEPPPPEPKKATAVDEAIIMDDEQPKQLKRGKAKAEPKPEKIEKIEKIEPKLAVHVEPKAKPVELPKLAKLETRAEPKSVPVDDGEVPGGGGRKAAPVETAEVSLDEMMTATNGVDTLVPGPSRDLHLAGAVGLGVSARNFAPGPSTLMGYSSSVVPTIHFDGRVEPTAHVGLAVVAERTLAMSTDLADGSAPTTMSLWEATAGYTGHVGSLAVTPMVGVGRRAFSIMSNDPARAPDNSYDYLLVGAGSELAIGKRVAVRAHLAFEPVVGGTEPTEMVLGEASRWALAVGAAVELHPVHHVFVRASADYQRFAWSWSAAGSRGAGGAVDHYPSGTLSLGAEY
jgi:hypothetical protein